MCPIGMRLSIRSFLVATALVGVNLAGAIATSEYFHYFPRVPPVGYGNGWGFVAYGSDGSISVYAGNAETGRQLTRVVRPLCAPPILQICSPAIAASSVTFLVITLLWAIPDSKRGVISASAEAMPRTRTARVCVWIAMRRLTLAVSLIGLNVAGAVYRPLPDREELVVDNRYLSSSTRVSHVFTRDGAYLNRYHLRGIGHDDDDNGPLHPMNTIVFKADGAILSYDGTPGETRSRPFVLRPPRRSFLVMWFPLIASVTTTILVVVMALRRRAA
jgi:hypothetical protein